MPTPPTAYPDVATRDDWLAARKKLLAREREVTHLRDAVNAERRRLPMVKVEKDYVFEGPRGEVRLHDMFEGRAQLYIHHFMWIDAIDEGCPSCTAAADMTFTQKDRALLNAKGVTFACVSRAPYRQHRAVPRPARVDIPVVLVARQRLQLRLPRHAGPRPGAARVQLQVARRAARRRLERRRPARRRSWCERVPAPRRRGVPHLFRLCTRP